MKKKHYDLTLDGETAEMFRAWLRSQGIAFSTYMNEVMKEQVEFMKKSGIPLDGRGITGGLTGKQLAKIFAETKRVMLKKHGLDD